MPNYKSTISISRQVVVRAPTRVERLRRYYPQASLLVHATDQGEVLDAGGSGDREGLAAVAAVTSKAFTRAVDKLCLGRLEGWALEGGDHQCLSAVRDDDLDVAFMPVNRDNVDDLSDFIDQADDLEGETES